VRFRFNGEPIGGTPPLESLSANHGHAYLGYLNLSLGGMLRRLKPENPCAAFHDRITEALARRLATAPHGLIETYPGETYPPDLAMVAGSIALHGRATGADHRALTGPTPRGNTLARSLLGGWCFSPRTRYR
jgi:hypothetical protein